MNIIGGCKIPNTCNIQKTQIHQLRRMTLIKKRCASTTSAGAAIALFDSKIKRLVSEGLCDETLNFYAQHIHPFQLNTNTAFVLPSITKACAHSQSRQNLGQQIHCNVLKNGFDAEFTISNSLLSMYVKFSETGSARKVFGGMPSRDTISWNSMINCYTQNGFFLEALNTFRAMYTHGFVLKPELVASCLSTCIKSEDWRLGRAIHALVFLDERIECASFVATSLVNFYWKLGNSDAAFRVFYGIVERNEVSWTAMINGCIEDRDYVKAFAFCRMMQCEDIKPNKATLVSILPACAELHSISLGKEIHGYALRHGYDLDARFLSALLHMYCKFGALHIAKLIFERSVKKEIVMWSSMIAGYSHDKDSARQAIKLFNEMQMEGIQPNSVTLLALISACNNLLSATDGSGVHGYGLKSGLATHVEVQNALIDMYYKCGSFQDSVKVFDEMPTRDCISWSSLISAYGLYGYAEEALKLFYKMKSSGLVKADGVIYLAVLSTCNHAGFVEEGQTIYNEALEDVNVSLTMEHYACYIDLLARAGKLEDAYGVLCGMRIELSSRILSSLVSACKIHGRLDIAESLARVLVGIEPENAANYTLLSMVYAECDNWSGVEEVRKFMKDRELRKNPSYSKI